MVYVSKHFLLCLTTSSYGDTFLQTTETREQSTSEFDGCDEKSGGWGYYSTAETCSESANAPRQITVARHSCCST